MANLTKNIGTVTLTGTAEKVTLPASYGWVWVKNMSEGDIFAGLSEDISEGADGVMVIPSGECGRIQADGFRSVWLLGTGNALVVAQNYAECPFKAGAKGGGSGGSGGGMELIGSYAFTYSGTATGTTNANSDYIQILPEIPEKNRTFLIYAEMLMNKTYKYNYSGIVKMFGNTADDTSNVVRLNFDVPSEYYPILYLITNPTKEGYGLQAYMTAKAKYLKSGYFSIDIYDMGVIE